MHLIYYASSDVREPISCTRLKSSCRFAGAYTKVGGGVTFANEPPRSLKFRFKISGMRAHCVLARFRDRSRPCFIACEVQSSFTMQAPDRRRARGQDRVARGRVYNTNCTSLGVSWLLTRSGQVFSVQNGEHREFLFCSKKRFDEEKSFRGHSFLPAKRGASSAEPPFCLASIWNGEGISERNLFPRLIDIVVVRR